MTDASALHEPWASDVARATDALARFDRAAGTAGDGPLRERLTSLRPVVSDAVDRCASVAVEGQQLSRTLAELGPDRIAAELKDARRAAAAATAGSPVAEAMTARVSAAEAQYRVVHRMWDAVDGARARIAADLARLDELVARTLELTLLPPGDGAEGVVDVRRQLDDVVDDLDALRQAFAELQRPGGGTRP